MYKAFYEKTQVFKNNMPKDLTKKEFDLKF